MFYPSPRASQKTIMEAYFIYLNGTAIDSDTVENILSQPEHFLILSKYGLTYIVSFAVDELEPLFIFCYPVPFSVSYHTSEPLSLDKLRMEKLCSCIVIVVAIKLQQQFNNI